MIPDKMSGIHPPDKKTVALSALTVRTIPAAVPRSYTATKEWLRFIRIVRQVTT